MKPALAHRDSRVQQRAVRPINPVALLTAAFLLTVLLLHHGSYTHDYIWRLRQIEVNKYLQQMAVGGFLFLSGYKLMLSKAEVSPKAFWQNRFVRIYPPYLLAVIAYSFTDYVYRQESLPSLWNFLLHASLLQSLLPHLLGESYRTLWFVSLLFCCYVFFIATRRLVTRFWPYVAAVVLLAAVICNCRNVFAGWGVDVFIESFEVFVLFFSCGMLYAVHQQKVQAFIQQNIKPYRISVLMGAGVLSAVKLAAIASGASEAPAFYYFNVIAILLTTIPLYFLFLSGAIEVTIKRPALSQLIRRISTASFFIFLFHRPIWSVLANIWTGSGLFHSLYIFSVGLPLIFAVSYWGQTTYSALVKSR
ncbi:MAG: acyltransferase [Cyanobacteria bacterium P01_F01_bin.3]